MDYLLAKTDRQLGLALRMLDDEGIPFSVEVVKDSKRRTEFYVHINVPEDVWDRMSVRFDNLTR